MKIINRYPQILILPIFIVGLLVPAGQAKAGTYFDNFDSYSVGDLSGNGSWTTLGSGVDDTEVTTDRAFSGLNSVQMKANAPVGFVFPTEQTDVVVRMKMYRIDTGSDALRPYRICVAHNDCNEFEIIENSNGNFIGSLQNGTGGGQSFGELISDGAWHDIEWRYHSEAGDFHSQLYVDGSLVYDSVDWGFGITGTTIYGWTLGTSNIGSFTYWYDDLEIYWDTDVPAPPDSDTTTRIISVIPPHDPEGDDARATSTTFAFEAEGYINSDDYVEDTFLRIFVRNDAAIPTASLAGPAFSSGGAALCNAMWDWLCPPTEDNDTNIVGAQTSWFQREYEMDIGLSGSFSFATTTDVQQIGRYTMTTQIIVPRFTFLGEGFGQKVLVGTTTSFLVATSTWYDVAHVQAQDLASSLAEGANTYNCEVDFSTLFGILDIGDCVKYLFAGSDGIVVAYIQDSIAGLTSRAPWGYATRVYVIITQPTATSTLPSIAAEIPEGLPMAGSTFDFSPWEGTQAAIVDLETRELPGPTTGTVMENFLHWWNILWALMFAFWIAKIVYSAYELGDFEDLGFVGGDAHGRIRRDVHGRKYQEWSTKDIQRAVKKGERRGIIH